MYFFTSHVLPYICPCVIDDYIYDDLGYYILKYLTFLDLLKSKIIKSLSFYYCLVDALNGLDPFLGVAN